MFHKFETTLAGKPFIIETGAIAKQASGSVTVRYGDTMVLVTAVVSKDAKDGADFLPLSCDYVEKTFAAGKIPGGFFKREGRPSEREVLTSRFIDRPIRPLFPDGYFYETQIIATVLSADEEHESDIMAIIGASAALIISEAPFLGPIAGVRVGRVDGKFVLNPTNNILEKSDIDIIVAGSKDAVVMMEGGGNEVSEADMLAAIEFAHEQMQPLIALQMEMKEKIGKPKIEIVKPEPNKELINKVRDQLGNKLVEAAKIKTKAERYTAYRNLKNDLMTVLVPEGDETGLAKMVESIIEQEKYETIRKMIVKDGLRIDGRKTTEIRPITCEIDYLPRTHGSALFTRGETQALVVTTLGTKEDQQLIDSIGGEYYKHFMLHYNFPPFSVGEVKFLRSPGRREVGHGALAERSIRPLLPKQEDFPYTIRLVSEILESNGSSSMASVCGSSLSLMAAGVPLKDAVAGIAMGLIHEGKHTVILSDILGDEDHLGDMDFKVAGTKNGITSIQMDIKITGLTKELLAQALTQAREGRLHILEKMNKVISQPKTELSQYAPKLTTIRIPVDRIGDLIGPGGKNIRKIIEDTGATIDINDDGTVIVGAMNQASGDAALKLIKEHTAEVEPGKYYQGKVVRIADFGAFVEIYPKVDGLIHISQLEKSRVNKVTDVLNVGDKVIVKCTEVDKESGKVRLSRKDALDYDGPIENA
ncbi:MAG: polyribonucleotide nucleotidyltransferase [Pseudomonadota bacterium]